MNFDSIEQIVSHFNLDAKEADEVKGELRKLLQIVHPDKSNGNFTDDKSKNLYYEILEAFNFLSDSPVSTSLATKNDITALTKVLKDLALYRKEETASEAIEKKALL